MRLTPKSLALTLSLLTPLVPVSAFAQAGAAGAPQAASGDADVKQMALTPAMIDHFVAAKKDVDAMLAKLPEGADQPDASMVAKLDAVTKKFGFDSYSQYDAVENNIGIVMAGIDPTTKKYVGPEAVIKKQIADVQADKQISPKDKKDTIDQLNAAMTSVPKLQNTGNVDVVVGNYDRLNEAMPQD